MVEDFWNHYGDFYKLEEKFGRTRYVFNKPPDTFPADDNRLLIEVEELSTSLRAFLPKATILAHDGAEIYYDGLFSAAQNPEKRYIAGPLLRNLRIKGIKNFLETQAGDLSDHINPEAIPVHDEAAPNDSAEQAAPTRKSIFPLFQKAAALASTPDIMLEKKRKAWQAAQEEAGSNPINQYNIWDKLKCFKGLELPFNFATPAGKLIEEFYKNYERKENFLDKGLMQGITPTMSEQEFVRFATPIILEYRKEEFLATLDENFLRQATCTVIKKDFMQIATNVSQYIDHGCEALLIGLERIEAEREPQETITAQNKERAQASAAAAKLAFSVLAVPGSVTRDNIETAEQAFLQAAQSLRQILNHIPISSNSRDQDIIDVRDALWETQQQAVGLLQELTPPPAAVHDSPTAGGSLAVSKRASPKI